MQGKAREGKEKKRKSHDSSPVGAGGSGFGFGFASEGDACRLQQSRITWRVGVGVEVPRASNLGHLGTRYLTYLDGGPHFGGMSPDSTLLPDAVSVMIRYVIE